MYRLAALIDVQKASAERAGIDGTESSDGRGLTGEDFGPGLDEAGRIMRMGEAGREDGRDDGLGVHYRPRTSSTEGPTVS